MKRVFCIGNGESRKDFNLETLRPKGKIYGCNALFRDFTPDVLVGVDHGIMHEIYHSGYAKKNETYLRSWTKVPTMMFDQMVFPGVSEEDKKELKQYDIMTQNEQGDAQQFVMHGSNVSGLVQILKKDKTQFQRRIDQKTVKISWIGSEDNSHCITEAMPEDKPKDLGWACGPTSGLIACYKEQPDEVYMIGHDLNSKNNFVNNLYKGTDNYALPEKAPIPSVNWVDQWKKLFDMNPKTQFYKVNEKSFTKRQPGLIDNVNRRIKEWGLATNIHYIDFQELDRRLAL